MYVFYFFLLKLSELQEVFGSGCCGKRIKIWKTR